MEALGLVGAQATEKEEALASAAAAAEEALASAQRKLNQPPFA